MKGRPWEYKEEELILKRRKKGATFTEIAKELSRSESGVRQKYNKLLKYGHENREEFKLERCPICGSRDIGMIHTVLEGGWGTTIARGYFCRNCLTEWTKNGILEPIWN